MFSSKRVFGPFFPIVLFLFTLSAPVAAQEDAPVDSVHFGFQLSYAEDTDFGIGARAEMSLRSVHPALRVVGSFDYFFPDNAGLDDVSVTYYEVNANLVYGFTLENNPNLAPYVGGGLGWTRASVSFFGESASGTKIGTNVLVGSFFGTGKPRFFAEIRFESRGGGEQAILAGGLVC